ncbi:unnamed protein product, partial [Dovyalis caffra]
QVSFEILERMLREEEETSSKLAERETLKVAVATVATTFHTDGKGVPLLSRKQLLYHFNLVFLIKSNSAAGQAGSLCSAG